MRHLIRLLLLLPLFAMAQSYENYFAAVRSDSVSRVSALLTRGFDPNTVDPDGNTGLLLAISESSFKVANFLVGIDQVDVNLANRNIETPLMLASLRGYEDLVRKLLARGADVNQPGWAPLHYAAAGGHIKIMQWLLEHHAYVDAESPNGTTPLMMAAGYGSGQAVQLLLDEGAVPTIKNKVGFDALAIARQKARPDAIAILSRLTPAATPTAAPTATPTPAPALPQQTPALAEPTAAQATQRQSAYALVIGNAAYRGWARLNSPLRDADAMGQKLRAMGFSVTSVNNANRQQLMQAMVKFRLRAASADVSVLFYAGRGAQVLGKNYLMPTDADLSDAMQASTQGVSLGDVLENFMPGKTRLVLMDARLDHPLQHVSGWSLTKDLDPVAVPPGALIIHANRNWLTALDDGLQKNSFFTQALLDHLDDQQNIASVLRKVREKVVRATSGKQLPWEQGSLADGGGLILSATRPDPASRPAPSGW